MSYLDHVEKVEGLQPDIASLSTYFAKIVTSRHNQHALVQIVGSAGTGKSWAGVKLAVETAKKIAEFRKTPDWNEYYSFDNNLAVINRDEVKRVMTNPRMYNVIHLDDIGVGWNARKYKDDYNIYLNDIIQTFRPNHNLVIMTLQAGFLLDKVPRSLAHYLITMEQAYFDQGFTVAKVFQIKLKHLSGKIFYEYVNVDGATFIRHVFQSPAGELMEQYEQIRASQLEKLNKMKDDEQKEQKAVKKKDYLVGVVDGIMKEFGVSQRTACRIAGCSATYYQGLKA